VRAFDDETRSSRMALPSPCDTEADCILRGGRLHLCGLHRAMRIVAIGAHDQPLVWNDGVFVAPLKLEFVWH
jgi:hypothetical protein